MVAENQQRNMQYEELESLIIQWASERRIIPNATSASQCLKAASEMGELCDAVNKSDLAGLMDGVGDVIVCLINLCALNGLKVTGCLELAYSAIKDRKGTLLPNGVFVKH